MLFRSFRNTTYTHEVRGTGRSDQVPARAVADIEEEGMIDFKFLARFGSQAPSSWFHLRD